MVTGRSATHRFDIAFAIAAFLVLVLAGCGEAASEDPFVGTWRDPDGSMDTVIAKTADGYRVTVFFGTWANAERDGERLRAWVELLSPSGEPTGKVNEAIYTYQPASGQLVLTDPAGPGIRIELVRESASTAIPSPWPSGSRQ